MPVNCGSLDLVHLPVVLAHQAMSVAALCARHRYSASQGAQDLTTAQLCGLVMASITESYITAADLGTRASFSSGTDKRDA